MNKSVIEKNKLKYLNRYFTMSDGSKCKVVDYLSAQDVFVETEDGQILKRTLRNLRVGNVRNPTSKTFLNKGLVGTGKYSSKDRDIYELWSGMMERAYCEKFHSRSPTYKVVTVCDEWLNFQNFAEWCISQKFYNAKDCSGRNYCLDKDILIKGNKVYSPKTCCFVPHAVNNVISNSRKIRGDCPVGVNYHKASGNFQVNLKHKGFTKYLGLYNTKEEAFLVYKKAKEDYIKSVAEKHKETISSECYNALMNWNIEITD